MRSVEWSDLAILDLEKIDDYWIDYSEEAAEEISIKIERAAEFLTTMPGAGPGIGERDARKWSVSTTRYVIMYRVLPTSIEILRVAHESQNWTAF
jgi:toxin ParE1/3/4